MLDVIGTTDEEHRPTIQVQELIQPVGFSDRVGGSDLPFQPIVFPIVKEGTESNILLLANIEFLSPLVGWIAISMDDAIDMCNLLTQRMTKVLLREGFNAHFLGNRSSLGRLADLLDEIPKFTFCKISWQLIFMACADEYDAPWTSQVCF
jgi:hypothetical protein